MGQRALEFAREFPDAAPGYVSAVERLERSLARFDQLLELQRIGLEQEKVAGAQRERIRTLMLRGHLSHMMRVAKLVDAEVPGVALKFRAGSLKGSFLTFRTGAKTMLAEVQGRRELFVRHGLAEPVIEGLVPLLAELDSVTLQSASGRRAHISATEELHKMAREIVQVVRTLEGLNQVRFAGKPEHLAAWKSASRVTRVKSVPAAAGSASGPSPSPVPTPLPEAQDRPPAGEEKPAA